MERKRAHPRRVPKPLPFYAHRSRTLIDSREMWDTCSLRSRGHLLGSHESQKASSSSNEITERRDGKMERATKGWREESWVCGATHEKERRTASEMGNSSAGVFSPPGGGCGGGDNVAAVAVDIGKLRAPIGRRRQPSSRPLDVGLSQRPRGRAIKDFTRPEGLLFNRRTSRGKGLSLPTPKNWKSSSSKFLSKSV